jgi:hypothetical protein
VSNSYTSKRVTFPFLCSRSLPADVTTVLTICMILIFFMNRISLDSLVIYILVVRMCVEESHKITGILITLFRQILVYISHTYPPIKIKRTECSETSTYKIQTPVNYPEESIQQILVYISHTYPPMKMEHTECSEMSAYKIQMPVNYPEERIQLIPVYYLKISQNSLINSFYFCIYHHALSQQYVTYAFDKATLFNTKTNQS